MSRKDLMKKAFDSIIDVDLEMAMKTVEEGAKEGITVVELLEEGFTKGMSELGFRFGRGEILLPELIYATELMNVISKKVEAELALKKEKAKSSGRMIMATVEGDVHDIGKSVCISMLKSCGIEVYDLGREVPADTIVAMAEELNVDIIGTSALLTSTMTVQQELEEKLKEKQLKDKYMTMVGGSPVNQRWAKKIGATAYSEDASKCCTIALELLENKRYTERIHYE